MVLLTTTLPFCVSFVVRMLWVCGQKDFAEGRGTWFFYLLVLPVPTAWIYCFLRGKSVP